MDWNGNSHKPSCYTHNNNKWGDSFYSSTISNEKNIMVNVHKRMSINRIYELYTGDNRAKEIFLSLDMLSGYRCPRNMEIITVNYEN